MDSRHPGTYVCTTKRGKLKLGRAFAESPDPAPVARVLAAVAAIDVLTDPAALAAARWAKLAINCATSTIGAIGGDRLGPLLGRRPVRRLVLELWSEIHAVVRAAGIRPAPIAGVDLSRLALSPRERRSQLGSPLLAGKHALLMAVGMKYRRMRSSMLIALERGRTPEIDFLNGEIVRRGTALGVPAPVNARLVAAVKAIAAGEASSSIDHLQKVCSEVMALSRAAAAVQQAPGLAAEPGLERSPTETAPSP
jgi:2-dehydropantoate 2-reductase